MVELLLVLILGIFLVYASWRASEKVCPPPSIEYRFIPRTFKEEQESPVKPSEIFSGMFDDIPILN